MKRAKGEAHRGSPGGGILSPDPESGKGLLDLEDIRLLVVGFGGDPDPFRDRTGKIRLAGLTPGNHHPVWPRSTEGHGAVPDAECHFLDELVDDRHGGFCSTLIGGRIDPSASTGGQAAITPKGSCGVRIEREPFRDRLVECIASDFEAPAESDLVTLEVDKRGTTCRHIQDHPDLVTVSFTSDQL